MTPAYIFSRNWLGLAEIPGQGEHPAIRWAFNVAGLPNAHDDTEAWCGAWQALTAKSAGDPVPALPARARSWLTVGKVIPLSEAQEGDTVILKRGDGPQPGSDVLDAQGHVGRLVSYQPVAFTVSVLAGNQGNKVSIETFPAGRVLGIRRL